MSVVHNDYNGTTYANIGLIRADKSGEPLKPSGKYVRQKDRQNNDEKFRPASNSGDASGQSDWRRVKVHVGRHTGIDLGELDRESVEALVTKWLPTALEMEKPLKADRELIAALQQAKQALRPKTTRTTTSRSNTQPPTTMLIVPRESASHWYFPDGTPLHEVPRADGKGSRPTSLRDARKLGLFPSVTNVLSILAKPGLDAWKQEQAILAALTLPRTEGEPLDDFARRVVTDMHSEVGRAADLGSAVHAAIEGYAQGRWLPEDKEVARLFEPARQWFDAEVTQVHSVEIAAAHLEWGYAGRVDLVATLKSTGRPTVIDFKTQKIRRDKDGSFKPILHDTWPLQLEAYRRRSPPATRDWQTPPSPRWSSVPPNRCPWW